LKENGTQAITLGVQGMTCAACQAHVERALRETEGVTSASVNLMTHSARVEYQPDVARLESLFEAVREAGYDVSLTASAESEEDRDKQERRLKWKAIAALVGGAVVMVLSMPLGMNGHPGTVDRTAMEIVPGLFHLPVLPLEYAMLLITLAGMIWAGGTIYQRAWQAARHRATNMNTLVALGTGAAFLYSLAATVAPGFFAAHGLRADIYYDSVLLILGFLLLGNWLDARAKRRTLDALHGFAALQPQTARVLRDGEESDVPVASLSPGELLIVRPGERIPVDGVIVAGASSIDESLITGESAPVPRTVGERVIGGSLNYEGALEYRATSIGADSVLGQMLRLMEEAQSSKAPMQQLADRVSAVFVPVVLALAALTFVVWTIAGHPGGAGRAFAIAVAVLVIACPCAMGLAVPAALTVAIGRAAQLGILFKGGESVERLARVDTIVLDKTGTITEGRPAITAVRPNGIEERDLVALAASLEQRSEHPLARAVLDYARHHSIDAAPAMDAHSVPGKGLLGTVQGKNITAGNSALMAEQGIPLPESAITRAGETALYIAVDGRYAGLLAARDQVRHGAADAISSLRRSGLRTIMLTGDNRPAAEEVGRAVLLDKIHAGLSPQDKLEKIREFQQQGRKVAMVGDGINDAAALAQADAGLAVGTGTDLAREAGDAILLSGEPAQIVAAFAVARQTLRIMRQNLGWALGYNVVGIPIAAGVLYPATGILLSPAVAAAAMALSSVSVLANSLRLKRFASLKHFGPR
jgi:Cu+-exporting ATPase